MRLQVSLSAFCFLFSEMVQYQQTKVDTTQELEKKLAENGYNVGLRISELCFFREKNAKRETKIVGILSYIKDNIWKTMFGKAADSLERATDKQDECKLAPRPTPRHKCCARLRPPWLVLVFGPVLRVQARRVKDKRGRALLESVPAEKAGLKSVRGSSDMIHEREPLVNTYISVPKGAMFPPRTGSFARLGLR
jgi:hypothetical protein